MGFWAGLGAALLVAWPIFRILVQIKAQQVISRHLDLHQGKAGTPTMGGWIFVCAFVPVAAFLGVEPAVWVGFLAFALLGFADDFVVPRLKPGSRGLEWKPKIAFQFLLAGLYAWMAGHFGPPFGPWDFGRLGLDVFFVLMFSNAYNFTDGLDGLAVSVGLFLFAGLAGICLATGIVSMVMPLAILAGAMLPFAYLNAPKARLFMGDTGSMAVGALVGMTVSEVAAASAWHPEALVALAVVSFVMLAEIVPVPLQILWVKRFGRRLFPMTPIHHAFEKAGWREVRIVAAFAGAQFLVSALAVFVAWRFR